MALTITASGTQTATVGTDHTLTTLTGPKTFTLMVDANAMVYASTNDELFLHIYTKALSGGTERLAYSAYFVGQQDPAIKISIPIPVAQTATVKLTQVTGTSRDFPWNVTTPDS